MKDVREVVDFDEGCEDALANALQKRNKLVHEFFRRHAIDLLSYEGRERTITELKGFIETFKIADCVITAVSRVVTKLLGITDEMINEEFRKFDGN